MSGACDQSGLSRSRERKTERGEQRTALVMPELEANQVKRLTTALPLI